MSRDNKEIVAEINKESTPDMGARVPAGKGGRGENDALTAKHVNEAVRTAKEDVGAAKKAIDVQCGKNMDNMTQENSGCNDCDK